MGVGVPGRIANATGQAGILNLDWYNSEQGARENALSRAESLLGTPDQVAGRITGDEGLLRYSTQLAFDPSALELIDPRPNRRPDFDAINSMVTQANTLMGQAREAYLAGDSAKAEELYQQAQSLPGASKEGFLTARGVNENYAGQGSGVYDRSFNWLESGTAYEDAMARSLVSGPMAQQVGGLVAESRDLGNPESATYQRYYDEIVDPATAAIDEQQTRAERAIAIERQGSERRVRDMGLSRGAARSATAEAAVYQRFGDQAAQAQADVSSTAAQQRSELLAGAAQYMQEFATQFRFNAPQMAQAFLQNQGGIRESYMNRIQQSQLAIGQFSSQMATNYMQQMQLLMQQKIAQQQANAQKSMVMTQGFFDLGAALISGGAMAGGFALSRPPTPAGAS